MAAREHDAISKLEAAIAKADGQREELGRLLNGDEPSSSAPAIVSRLRDALVQALQKAPEERPWLVWRAFALRLHNQFGLTAAALSLMRVGIAFALWPTVAAPAPVIDRLKADVRVLERELASRKLKAASEANRTGDAIQLINQLIALESDAEQRQQWIQLRQQLEHKLWHRRLSVGFWSAVAAVFVWIIFGSAIAPGPKGATPSRPSSSSAPSMQRPSVTFSDIPYSPSLSSTKSRSSAYLEGQADWHAWDDWFNTLRGEYRNGAEHWATVRNNPKHGSCYGPGGRDLGEWTAGCLAAARKLAPIDRRRRAEPDYRAGWSRR